MADPSEWSKTPNLPVIFRNSVGFRPSKRKPWSDSNSILNIISLLIIVYYCTDSIVGFSMFQIETFNILIILQAFLICRIQIQKLCRIIFPFPFSTLIEQCIFGCFKYFQLYLWIRRKVNSKTEWATIFPTRDNFTLQRFFENCIFFLLFYLL